MFCAKRNINYEFREISKKGPPHDTWFTVHLYIENEMFGEGQGKSKRAADMEAARTGLAALQNRKIQKPSPDTSWDSLQGSNCRSNDRKSVGNGTTDGSAVVFTERSSLHTTQSKTNVAQSPLSEFEDITELSAGGFGKVFKAWKTMDLKYYAVKKVKMRNEKCKSEVQALARLDHPNIVRYFHSWTGTDFSIDTRSCSSSSSSNIHSDCSTEDYSSDARSCSLSSSRNITQRNEYLYIQMEFCENGDLRDWISNMKTVDKKKSLDIFRNIVEGVIYIHSEKLIHRDLKPANIFFAKDMRVKIGDLGLVTQMSSEDSTEALIRTDGTGTKSYMAPEQDYSNYNSEVDIFALGLILVELLYLFGTVHEKNDEWGKIRNCQMPEKFVANYPVETYIIMSMLSTDPTKRPTATKLKELLEEKSYSDSRTY
ncbi:interferon-induced, double-stranded RNA-activated protein kinase isoform X8 [Xenopus laevis]|uniref:non-specific serine/threonine protein kinase n=1 Tax=Xenopus laevis TaxID=8355 RepID=A0A8J0VBI4_XENLA|nr:interferon-induced, double-stranded RNA-activated protein kinase isoform X8 [Xenopus laevis]